MSSFSVCFLFFIFSFTSFQAESLLVRRKPWRVKARVGGGGGEEDKKDEEEEDGGWEISHNRK